ncbi:helix-turn-helix domain-containing protein [Ktedonobacter robiniae]|uniref:helix-turn-helix domain-containing protein n=1 Tax=Ktedonobacter robiniae TaxID=2778365 RepID=UPI0019154ED4
MQTHSLADAPRSGVHRRFSPAVRAHATAIACSLPQTQRVSLARWSRGELARFLVAAPELPRASSSTIGRWFKNERMIACMEYGRQRVKREPSASRVIK